MPAACSARRRLAPRGALAHRRPRVRRGPGGVLPRLGRPLVLARARRGSPTRGSPRRRARRPRRTTAGLSAVTVSALSGGDAPSGQLQPGGTADVVLRVTNPNAYPVTLVERHGERRGHVGGRRRELRDDRASPSSTQSGLERRDRRERHDPRRPSRRGVDERVVVERLPGRDLHDPRRDHGARDVSHVRAPGGRRCSPASSSASGSPAPVWPSRTSRSPTPPTPRAPARPPRRCRAVGTDRHGRRRRLRDRRLDAALEPARRRAVPGDADRRPRRAEHGVHRQRRDDAPARTPASPRARSTPTRSPRCSAPGSRAR